MDDLEIPGSADDVKVFLDFRNIDPYILDNLDSEEPMIFVIPEWPIFW